jgi:hypothetical protein
MTKDQIVKNFLVMLALVLLPACGGGGAGGNGVVAAGSAAPPPASGPSITKVGAITGFGSVYVEGERFETSSSGTSVRKDDLDADEDELRVGMVVRVRATSKNANGEWIADDIEFDEDVKGPIDSIGADSLVVLGQTVNISDDTHFDDGSTLADFNLGDVLEVSGLRNEMDQIDASFIERKNSGDVDKYEVRGQVRNLDSDNQRFEIGGLTVNYGLAEVDDLEGGLANGLLVEVKDEIRAYQSGDLVLDATKVEGEDRFEFKDEDENDDRGNDRGDDDESEITAVITEILNDTTFMMGSIEVRHDSRTEFSGGSAEDLVVGARVEVEGSRIDADVLSAREIEFERSEARLAGLVNEVDGANSEATVMGVVARVAGAEMRDELSGIEPFTLMDLDDGNFVEVRGSETDNVINARELRRDDTDRDSEMRGLLDDFDATAQTVTIFGKLIVTNGSTRYRIEDASVSAETFFNRLHSGQSVVDADWDGAFDNTTMPARELSLED